MTLVHQLTDCSAAFGDCNVGLEHLVIGRLKLDDLHFDLFSLNYL